MTMSVSVFHEIRRTLGQAPEKAVQAALRRSAVAQAAVQRAKSKGGR